MKTFKKSSGIPSPAVSLPPLELIVLVDRVQQLLVLGGKFQRLDAVQVGPGAGLVLAVVQLAPL